MQLPLTPQDAKDLLNDWRKWNRKPVKDAIVLSVNSPEGTLVQDFTYSYLLRLSKQKA